MKLRRVWIKRYGALQQELACDGSPLVLYGPNESGKTLLVEALLKFLAGDEAVPDARVAEAPEGFVVVDDGNGEHKLETGDTLVEYFNDEHEYEISASDLRNIFVIQDADLRIDGEDEFYERVTDKITGIRTQDIRRIKAKLREEGRLMAKRDEVSTAAEHDEAGDQVDGARDLKRDVVAYLEAASENEIPAVEGRLFEARIARRRLVDEIEALRNARERESYESLVEATRTIEARRDELSELPDVTVIAELEQGLNRLGDGDREELVDRKERYSTFVRWALAAAVLAFAVSVIAGASAPSLMVPGIAFILALYFFVHVRRASADLATLETARESVLAGAHRAGLAVERIDDLRTEVGRVRHRRRKLTDGINERKGVLKNQLDITADDPDAVLQQASDRLAHRAETVEFDLGRAFDESALRRALSERDDVERRIQRLERKLEAHRRRLREFADRTHHLDFRAFTGESLDLQLTNVEALEALVDRLDGFIESIETDAELSLAAHRVFDRLEGAEEEKVTTLFGRDSEATSLFETVTDGRYERIGYDPEAHQLVVRRPNEQTFTPDELSKGTRDQLYMCVRIALAKRLPDVTEGFFILDDAFLASDGDRLTKQVAVLENLVEQGWQIIYLTAKQEAVDALSPLAGSDLFELDRLP